MDNGKFSGIFIPRARFYLLIIFILDTIITLMDWKVGMSGYFLLVLLTFYSYKSNRMRQKEITRYIENLTFNMNTATKDTLLNFPMPLVVLQLDGTIIWYNSSFRRIFDGEDLLEKTISIFMEELDIEGFSSERSNITREIRINDKHYHVLGNFVKLEEKSDEGEFILMLYLIDNTGFMDLKRRYDDEKTAIGLIVIDNYDELMQSMEDSNRPQMLAEIEKKIVQGIGFTGGIIRKFERDKYLFVFELKYLKELEEKKFDVLDTVKEINIGNKIPVTLSLGFGVNGKAIIDNFRFAATSIDIALGRGGDQVVIKDDDNFSFFGGRTREMEKRTRVKARVIAYALRELIDQSSSVLIMGHENADIDCLGSALGLYRVAKNRGKDAYVVLSQSNPTIDKIIAKIKKQQDYDDLFIGRSEALDSVDSKTLIIVVDTHRPAYTECPELLEYTDQVVVMDHHRRGVDFIQDAVLTYQETYASSTCELVAEVLQYVEEKIKLKPIEAEALYAGIVVDTKNFTFKTGVRTFEAASFLRRQGVDTVAVKQLFQNNLSTYINISNVVRDAEILNENMAISICPAGVKGAQLIAAQAADQLVTLSGLVAAFVLSSANGEIFISGRSLGEVNVQVILEKLGGGGHMTIAGAQLQGITVDEAKERLKHVIIEYMQESNNE